MLVLGKLGDLSLSDSFFDSFKLDYIEFEEWYRARLNHPVYYFLDDIGKVRVFLKFKLEETNEDYSEMTVKFKKSRRLKICSLKSNLHSREVILEMKDLIEKEAKKYNVSSIYITVREDKVKLIKLLESWRFSYICNYKKDKVYVRRD